MTKPNGTWREKTKTKSAPNNVRIMRMQWTVKYRPIVSGRPNTMRIAHTAIMPNTMATERFFRVYFSAFVAKIRANRFTFHFSFVRNTSAWCVCVHKGMRELHNGLFDSSVARFVCGGRDRSVVCSNKCVIHFRACSINQSFFPMRVDHFGQRRQRRWWWRFGCSHAFESENVHRCFVLEFSFGRLSAWSEPRGVVSIGNNNRFNQNHD